MAVFGKAEFAEFCGVNKAHISVGIKRGKIAVSADGKIDSTNPVNEAFRAKCIENAARKSSEKSIKTPKMAEFPGKTPRKVRVKKQPENVEIEPVSTVPAVINKKMEIEIEEKQARTEKLQQEMAIMRLKEAKLTGQVIPTDLVANTIRQLMQSTMTSFNDAADAILVDISKKFNIDRVHMADLRSKLKAITNEAVSRSITDAQKNINNIVAEHSQNKGQTMFG